MGTKVRKSKASNRRKKSSAAIKIVAAYLAGLQI